MSACGRASRKETSPRRKARSCRSSKSRWRNYDVGEIWNKDKRTFELFSYPGEIWIRYTNDPKEEPQRVDLRRNCAAKDMYQNPFPQQSSIRTSQLPAIKEDLKPITAFPLYTNGPLPIEKLKMLDMRKHAKLLPFAKREQYCFKDAGPDDESDHDGRDTEDEATQSDGEEA